MSTYTDLHIRTKENITILRMPGNKYDGMTPQRVIFANPENIYYGTFHGDLKALSTDFTQVMLNDCSVINGIISGTTLYSDDGQAFPVQFFIDSLSAFDTLSDFALLSTMSTISSNLSGALAQLQEFQKNAEISCNTLCANLSSLSSQVASIGQSSIDGLSTVSSYIQNELDSFQESVETSCHRLCIELSGTQADVQDVIGQLEQFSTDVNSRLSELADGIERNLSSISTISDDVSSINNSISDMHEDISALSDELSTISDDFLKYKEDSSLSIDHLAQRMTNGLMYKQSLVIDNDNADGTLSGLFRINDFESSYPLSAGYFYIAKIAKHEDIQKKYSYSGVEVGFGDWLIVNNGCTVGTITSNDIDVLDGQDYDNFKLSDDNEAYGSNTFNGPTTFNSNVQFNDSVEASSIAASQVSAGCISVSNWEHIYSSQQTLADALDSKISSISAEYNAISNHIHLSANGIIVGDIDCEAFTKDGMLTDVQLLDDELVFSFNSAASSDSISIALSDFIDKSQYYTSSQTSSDIQLSNAFSKYAPLSDIHGDYIEDVNSNKIEADRDFTQVEFATSWVIDDGVSEHYLSGNKDNANEPEPENPQDGAVRYALDYGWAMPDIWTLNVYTYSASSGIWNITRQTSDVSEEATELEFAGGITATWQKATTTTGKLATEEQVSQKQDQLSKAQIDTLAADAERRETIVNLQGNITKTFYWTGTVTKITLADAELWDETQLTFAPITKIEFGTGVETIDSQLFMGCTTLEEVRFPSSLVEVKSAAFKNCTSLNIISLPKFYARNDGGNWVGRTFEGCTNLVQVEIPGSLKRIAPKMFYNCTRLTEVEIGDGVQEIGLAAFAGTSVGSGPTLYIPSSVRNINGQAFRQTKIINVILNEGVEYISGYAFQGCTNLMEITVPSTAYLQNDIFAGCTSLEKIVFKGKSHHDLTEDPHWPFGLTTAQQALVETFNDRIVDGNGNIIRADRTCKSGASWNWYISGTNRMIGTKTDSYYINDEGTQKYVLQYSDSPFGWTCSTYTKSGDDWVLQNSELVTKWALTNYLCFSTLSTDMAWLQSSEDEILVTQEWVSQNYRELSNLIYTKSAESPDWTDKWIILDGEYSQYRNIILTAFVDPVWTEDDDMYGWRYIAPGGMLNNTVITLLHDATNDKWSFKISNGTITPVETVSADGDFNEKQLAFEGGWVLERCAIADRLALENDISKVFIKNPDDLMLSSGAQSNLSVIKLTNEEYATILLNDEAQPNALYVISDDCIDTYGMQIKNLAEPTISSDAVTKKYVDDISSTLSSQIQTLSGDLSYEISSLEDTVVSNDACLSAAVDKKIFIDSLSTESLCAIHISQDDFYQKVALSLSTIKDNELYIVSGDYINAYGQQMKNLSAPTDLSDATTKEYVDQISSTLSNQIQNLSTDLSTEISALTQNLYDQLQHIAEDETISSLNQKSCISNVICAVVGIKDTLISLRKTLSGMLGL